MLHDPTLYPEPDIFKPERFIDTDGNLRDDPNLTSAFGFGKRICPGRHVVDATLFIVVASLLSAFNIKREEGDGSKPPDYTFTGTLTRYLPKFFIRALERLMVLLVVQIHFHVLLSLEMQRHESSFLLISWHVEGL